MEGPPPCASSISCPPLTPPLSSSDPEPDHSSTPLREPLPDLPPATTVLPPHNSADPLSSGAQPPSSIPLPSSSISIPPPPHPPLAAAHDLRLSDPPAIPTSSSYHFPPPLFYSAAAPSAPPPSDQFPPLSSAKPLSSKPSSVSPLSSALPLYAPAATAGIRPPPPPVPPRDPPQPSPLPPSRGTAPPPRSYAQVSRGLKGSGFVRSHASEIESFARLPRTGANVICGSKEGIPSFTIVTSDLAKVEELYSNALVMKFHGGRPSLEVSHKEIQSWGLEQPFTIGPLSSRAFLLRFQDKKDLIRVLSRPSSILITFPYKIFRWHNLCHIKEDSCYAPVWISLPRLPLQCFIPEFLESVANKIGRFLCFDKATATLARPSTARICIELDLRKSPPPFIWVGLFEGLKQPIIYEKVPKFCSLCIAQGHMAVDCPSGQREAISKQADPHSSSIRGRTPPVRQNATRQSPTATDHQYAPSATIHHPSIPAPPPPPPCAVPSTTQLSTRPPPPPDAPLAVLPSPAVANQSTDMHVQQPSAERPVFNPKQHKTVAFDQHPAPASQQTSSPVAAPPPPPQSLHTLPSSEVHPPSPIDVHLQVQPSAAAPAADVPPTSSAPPQFPPSRLSAAASSAGSLQPTVTPLQRPVTPSASFPPQNPQPSSNPPLNPCSLCFAQGHSAVECPTGHREAISKQTDPLPTSFHGCMPSVRQNASKKLPPTNEHQQASSTSYHNSSTPSPSPPPPYPILPAATSHSSAPNPSAQTVGHLDSLMASSSAHNPLGSLHQVSNMDANQLFWYAVNHQLALNEQARLKAPTVDARISPLTTYSSGNITLSPVTTVPHPSPSSDDSSSRSSMAADSQPNSPSSTIQGAHIHHDSFKQISYGSEGEAPTAEPTTFIGHNTNDMIWQRPRNSKRNKRHPDQPLKVQLRTRKSKIPNPSD